MEITLTKLQIDKIVNLIEIGNGLKSQVTELEEKLIILKTKLAEKDRNNSDILETIIECNGVDLAKVYNVSIGEGKLKFDIKNDIVVPEVVQERDGSDSRKFKELNTEEYLS